MDSRNRPPMLAAASTKSASPKRGLYVSQATEIVTRDRADATKPTNAATPTLKRLPKMGTTSATTAIGLKIKKSPMNINKKPAARKTQVRVLFDFSAVVNIASGLTVP